MVTAANSSGNAVVQYFSGRTDVEPVSCGSYVRMEDDNSELASIFKLRTKERLIKELMNVTMLHI